MGDYFSDCKRHVIDAMEPAHFQIGMGKTQIQAGWLFKMGNTEWF